jgi:hypothetical protein
MHRFVHRNPNAAALLMAFFAATGQLMAQSPAPPAIDAAALVRRAVANHVAAEAAHHPQRFVLHKKDDRRDYIQEIIESPQGDVSLAIAANGALLSPGCTRRRSIGSTTSTLTPTSRNTGANAKRRTTLAR